MHEQKSAIRFKCQWVTNQFQTVQVNQRDEKEKKPIKISVFMLFFYYKNQKTYIMFSMLFKRSGESITSVDESLFKHIFFKWANNSWKLTDDM